MMMTLRRRGSKIVVRVCVSLRRCTSGGYEPLYTIWLGGVQSGKENVEKVQVTHWEMADGR